MLRAEPAGTRIWTTVDYDRDGRQSGCLRVPFSSNGSAYGTIAVPIICIRNGSGPTAVLVGGNHGDEYEGQVALAKLGRHLAPQEIRGRIIILPHLNMSAAQAGTRLSPVDGGNLNRQFPGDPLGGPTAMIAHYLASVLLPIADLVIDLHSGGTSLNYLPCCLIRRGAPEETARLIELARIFAAPITSISDGSGGGGAVTLSATAQALGVPALTTELGGAAAFSRSGEAIAINGILRVLHHIGLCLAGPEVPASPTTLMRVDGHEAFTYAPVAGIFEHCADIGDVVGTGQMAGFIHAIERPDQQPVTVRFTQSGLVACRRAPALTAIGDCLFKLVVEDERSDDWHPTPREDTAASR